MWEDIFEFWSNAHIDPDQHVHPADADVFARAQPPLNQECLPIPYLGPLQTAKVVLLFFNPGFGLGDVELANNPAGIAWNAGQRTGQASLPIQGDAIAAHIRDWCASAGVLGQFGVTPEQVADKLAILDLCAYHSRGIRGVEPMTAALPSCRVTSHWVQNTLFPRAIRGEIAVVCLRAAPFWGLKRAAGADLPEPQAAGRYGQCLFAPLTNRGGSMVPGSYRDHIVKVARASLGL